MKKKKTIITKECPICLDIFKVSGKRKLVKTCSQECRDISISFTQSTRLANMTPEERRKEKSNKDCSKNGERFKTYWASLTEQQKKDHFINANKAKKEKMEDPDAYLKFIRNCKETARRKYGPRQSKKCATCGKNFTKPPNKNQAIWKTRKYCTIRCAHIYRYKISKFLPVVIDQPIYKAA